MKISCSLISNTYKEISDPEEAYRINSKKIRDMQLSKYQLNYLTYLNKKSLQERMGDEFDDTITL